MREGEPSATARHVAARRLAFVREPAAGRPADDEALARDVAVGVEVREGRLHEYLRARTSFVDRAVVAALDDGVTQVVVVGAGYDGRALRYARPGVRFFEVDHPATQADKRARLARLAIDADEVTFVPVDLAAGGLVAALGTAGHAADRASLFVLEGVASYLDPDEVSALLGDLGALAGPGSRLALTVGAGRSDGARDLTSSERFRQRVAAVGEPIRSTLDADEVRPLLAAAGWRAGGARGERRLHGLVLAVPAEAVARAR